MNRKGQLSFELFTGLAFIAVVIVVLILASGFIGNSIGGVIASIPAPLWIILLIIVIAFSLRRKR